jgi:hypothetical protein
MKKSTASGKKKIFVFSVEAEKIVNKIKNNEINDEQIQQYIDNITNMDKERQRLYNHILLFACNNGLDRIALMCIENGADVNVKDRGGDTPLHVASRNGYLEIVRVLLEKGTDVNVENKYGWTPLHTTSFNGYLEVVQYLVENGADVNAKNNDEQTPLDLAKRVGHKEIIRFLQGSLYDRLNVGNAKTNAQTEFINSSVMPMNAEEIKGNKFFYNVDNVDETTKKAKRVFQKELLNAFEDMKKDTTHPFTRKEWPITEENKIKQTLKRLPNTNVQNSPVRNNQVQQEGGKKTKEYASYKGKKYLVRHGTKGGKYLLVEGEKVYLKK